MHEGNGNRPFSNRRCDALDVAGSDISDGEYSGRLVSSRCGGRDSGQFAERSSSGERSDPVLMKPLLIERQTAISHVVLGAAPVITKT